MLGYGLALFHTQMWFYMYVRVPEIWFAFVSMNTVLLTHIFLLTHIYHVLIMYFISFQSRVWCYTQVCDSANLLVLTPSLTYMYHFDDVLALLGSSIDLLYGFKSILSMFTWLRIYTSVWTYLWFMIFRSFSWFPCNSTSTHFSWDYTPNPRHVWTPHDWYVCDLIN